MPRNANPVVGNTILREVIGADFLGTHTSPNSRTASSFDLAKSCFFLFFPKLTTQEVKGDFAVTFLVTFLGADNSNTGRLVDETYRG